MLQKTKGFERNEQIHYIGTGSYPLPSKIYRIHAHRFFTSVVYHRKLCKPWYCYDRDVRLSVRLSHSAGYCINMNKQR